MKSLILFLATALTTSNGFCMDPSQLNEHDFTSWAILAVEDPEGARVFLDQKHAERIEQSANRTCSTEPSHPFVAIAAHDNVDPFTLFADNEQLVMEYYAFLDHNPGVTPENFLLHEQQRIADNEAALAADINLFELEALHERMANVHIIGQREYIESYVVTRSDYPTIQAQRNLFAPILIAFTAVNPTNAQDLDVHAYDGFYGTHNAGILNILRSLGLGQNRDGNIYTAEQARDRAVAILQENGQADSINSVAAQLPGYFAGLSADDTELFCRLVGIVHDFVAHDNLGFVHYLLGIPENWTTQGGCVQGRRNRNLAAVIPLLRTLGLDE
jgi:hypothetical protein